MHKEVDSLVKNTAVLDPPDANHTYSAKVWGHYLPFSDFIYLGFLCMLVCECFLQMLLVV